MSQGKCTSFCLVSMNPVQQITKTPTLSRLRLDDKSYDETYTRDSYEITMY
jgi:hypothetical protein